MSSNRLENKVAIITGAAGGMGAAHVKRFIAEGAKVVFTDVQEEAGQKLAQELGENALFVRHDVTSEEDWAKVVVEAEKAFGPVNVLLNNAGIIMGAKFEDFKLEDFRKVMEVDFFSNFIGMQAVLPSMKKAGAGSIVNVSSVEGYRARPQNAAYISAKFGVRGLTKAAAVDLSPFNIRVNSVHPGAIATQMLAGEGSKDGIEDAMKRIPLGRVADPSEVSALMVFLASDESSYSTGAEFVIDGGLTALT